MEGDLFWPNISCFFLQLVSSNQIPVYSPFLWLGGKPGLRGPTLPTLPTYRESGGVEKHGEDPDNQMFQLWQVHHLVQYFHIVFTWGQKAAYIRRNIKTEDEEITGRFPKIQMFAMIYFHHCCRIILTFNITFQASLMTEVSTRVRYLLGRQIELAIAGLFPRAQVKHSPCPVYFTILHISRFCHLVPRLMDSGPQQVIRICFLCLTLQKKEKSRAGCSFMPKVAPQGRGPK